jgi:hypothetical protein
MAPAPFMPPDVSIIELLGRALALDAPPRCDACDAPKQH